MGSIDVVLSSGWLAFASHAGFLAALEELEIPVGAVGGTSSGALTGMLWAAGMPAREILALARSRRPVAWMRPHRRPWRGLMKLDPLVEELRRYLPASFADLPTAAGVGVIDGRGAFRLLRSGPLPEAVAASCAVPGLFAPVDVGGAAYADGGVADRLGLLHWREVRGGARPWVHLIRSSRVWSAPPGIDHAEVVHSPRSGAHLWSLGDAEGRFERTRRASLEALGRLG